MRSLLFLALLAASPLALAEVPASVSPTAAEVGHTREQPQALSHWQKMAEDMADQAAPRLLEQGVAVSAHAAGQASAFDIAFHDFFVTALHDRGVTITRHGYGARVEIDTYPLAFDGPRTTARVPRVDRQDRRSYGRGLRDELALNLRVFDGGTLAFSGSTTYYLPPADLGKYRMLRDLDAARAPRVDADGYRTLSGDYGTRTWGR